MYRPLTSFSLLLLLGCTAGESPVDIPFELRFGDSAIDCSTSAGGFSLTDLRFYVYDLRLITEDGRRVELELAPSPPWQSGEVALLDFEDGQGSCTNGTAAVNTVVRGEAGAERYRGLRFSVGVPEHLNHGDPLRAEPPLSDATMHWHWISGYRFLRAGITGEDDGFWLHLGSTRCEGTVTDIKGCGASNRAEVSLPAYVPGEDAVIIDLRQLFGNVDLADGSRTDCSSGPAETTCAEPFAALGIDFATGDAVSESAVFRVRSAR